jgi:hypothetical protein
MEKMWLYRKGMKGEKWKLDRERMEKQSWWLVEVEDSPRWPSKQTKEDPDSSPEGLNRFGSITRPSSLATYILDILDIIHR